MLTTCNQQEVTMHQKHDSYDKEQKVNDASNDNEDTPIINLVKDDNYDSLLATIQEMERLADSEGRSSDKKEMIAEMLNEKDDLGFTPLHWVPSVAPNAFKVGSLLLEHGAAINAVGNCGRLPIHIALYGLARSLNSFAKEERGDEMRCDALSQSFPYINLLIEKGSDLKKTGKDGIPALKYLTEAATVQELEEQFQANVNLKSLEDALKDYLQPSHSQSVSNNRQNNGSGCGTNKCILM